MSERLLVIVAGAAMLTGVAAGAFGAHGLRQILPPDMLAIWQTAVLYQIVHALGILAIALLMPRFGTGILGWAGGAMVIGIVMFSGSLYALALTGNRFLGAITPIGGAAFLLAWALVMWAAWKK